MLVCSLSNVCVLGLGSNSGPEAWQQAPLSAELSPGPDEDLPHKATVTASSAGLKVHDAVPQEADPSTRRLRQEDGAEFLDSLG